jgi:hypothetical protein
MHIRFLGLQKKVNLKGKDVVRSDLTLVSSYYKQRMDEKTLVIDASFVDRNLKITQRTGDQVKTLEERVEGPLYPAAVINLYPVLHGLRIGAKYKYQVFDPQVQAVVAASQSVDAFEESRKLLLEPSYKVNSRMHENLVSSWINLRGETLLEMASGGTLITYKEKEEDARRYLSEASLNKKDLILDFSLVRTENPIPCPRDATYLEISLEGIPEELPLLQGPGQEVTKRKIDGRTLALFQIQSGLGKYGRTIERPFEEGDLKKYLASSSHIESNHPQIKRTADQVAGGNNTTLGQVRSLVKWVSSEVKDDVEESTSALEVLHRKKGECQAHTLLYTALARAKGIPTRLVGGLVYAEGMGFLYHAWAESYVDGWIAIDPTFNQVGVDATHIKLVEGESWIALLQIGNIIGKVKADVISFRVSCQQSD